MTSLLTKIVKDRLEELEYVKETFEPRHPTITEYTDTIGILPRLSALINDVERLEIGLRDVAWMLKAVKHCIENPQRRDVISEEKLLKFEKILHGKLRKHQNRIEVSCLHANLLKEKLATQGYKANPTARVETGNLGEDFEVVETDPTDTINEIKREALGQSNVDHQAIEGYLSDIFSFDDGSALQDTRNSIQDLGKGLNIDVNEYDVGNALADLLDNDGITPNTKRDLARYSESTVARQQLAGILSMKNLKSWNYKNAEEGLSIKICSEASGSHRAFLDENVVDMLFLHLIASRWGATFRECFHKLVEKSSIFHPTATKQREIDRRSLYLGLIVDSRTLSCGVFESLPLPPPPPRCCPATPPPLPLPPDYCPAPPPPPPPCLPLPFTPPTFRTTYDRRKSNHDLCDATSELYMPFPCYKSLDSVRTNDYVSYHLMTRISAWKTSLVKTPSQHNLQSRIIKTLATDCRLRQVFDGSVSVSAFQFDSLSESLPHDTVITVLKYLGVSGVPLDFFQRLLRVKLHMRASHHVAEEFMVRTCGVPVNHSLGTLFTEVLMTLLEFAIRKKTGMYMYRLYNQCYFVGTRDQTTMFEDELSRFSQVMGIKAHHISSTGTLAIGLLILRPETSPSGPKLVVEIDNTKLTAYAQQLKTSLDACESVLDWVRVWNDAFGTYAAHLFGPLAAVFDKSHRQAVRDAHKTIYSIVLGGNNLTKHMTDMLEKQISGSLKEAPDALEPFIYVAQSLGGLGLKNPFLTISLARDFDDFVSYNIRRKVSAEDAYHAKVAEHWASCTLEQRQENIKSILNGKDGRLPSSFKSFKTIDSISLSDFEFETKEELFKLRESIPHPFPYSMPSKSMSGLPNLAPLYRCLLGETEDQPGESLKVTNQIDHLGERYRLDCSFGLTWEEIWTLNLYADECFERYGTLEIWWAKGLPVEIYNDFRGNKVRLIDDL
ncbi:hypothetical protein DDE83_006211 [Stemphylium lycopersici]|uniref:Reverse transcriptase domain-containing protein n=1 Tax=Stemphylium lycopersici TaxID=183478 RepID=A0A364MZX7_STELY|nr:hypothetical protein DDE83_006211 [Stemphylium lycopersici]